MYLFLSLGRPDRGENHLEADKICMYVQLYRFTAFVLINMHPSESCTKDRTSNATRPSDHRRNTGDRSSLMTSDRHRHRRCSGAPGGPERDHCARTAAHTRLLRRGWSSS